MADQPPPNPLSGSQKVAIPRLIAPAGSNVNPRIELPAIPAARTRAIRVAHACERCKARKIKCDGERPTCNHCSNADEGCRYVEKKRDTERRRVQDLESRVDHYERLLRDVQPHLPHSGLQLAIENALAGELESYSRAPSSARSSVSPARLSTVSAPSTVSQHRYPTGRDEAQSIGSGPPSHVSQDINTFGINNPFGYLGKCSCVWWIQRAREEIVKSNPESMSLDTVVDPRVPSVEQLDSTMYHLDDLGMPEATSDTSPFTVPPKHVADILINDYFRTVHPMFPLLSESIFRTQFEHLYEQRLEPLQAGAKWLAILNLVLAIGRSHCNLTEASNFDAGYESAADYFMRARILGALDGGILFQVPDLQQVQLLGLAAKYLMANHRINRSWNVACLAITQAQGLALHLENDAPTLDRVTKDIRYCVWHALYSIETALVLITGRVPLVREIHCSTPVPKRVQHDRREFDEQTAALADPYFDAQRALFSVVNEAVNLLYNTQSSPLRPEEYQRHVEEFEIELKNWKMGLHEELDFAVSLGHNALDLVHREKRLDLGVRYHNARMIIHRPFLCPIAESTEVQASQFAEASAKACIESARDLTVMVTSEDPHTMIRVGPWWSLVHFLSTAASVIALELAFKSIHVPDDRALLFELGDRIVNWFNVLQHVDTSSQRCYITLEEMMRQLRLHNAYPEGGESVNP